MKILQIILMVLCLVLSFKAFQKQPLIKMPTEEAIVLIEQGYLRQNLDDSERSGFEFAKSQILANQRAMNSANNFSLSSLFIVSGFVLMQGVILFLLPEKGRRI